MEEAVIVSAVRTPIGRANKGVLKDVRADDLAAIAVKAAVERVPQLDRSLIEDVILGCAFPEGETGYEPGAVGGRTRGSAGDGGGCHRQSFLRVQLASGQHGCAEYHAGVGRCLCGGGH